MTLAVPVALPLIAGSALDISIRLRWQRSSRAGEAGRV